MGTEARRHIFRHISRAWAPVLLAAACLCGCGPRFHSKVRADPGSPAQAGIFRDVTREAGLAFRWGHNGKSPLNIIETIGHGCGFLDYDQDGLLDIVLVGNRRLALYRNTGSGHFEDATQKAGLTAEGSFLGVAAGDFDNDGYPDLYITGYGKCVLYHNTGHGSFEDVTARAGVAARGPYDSASSAAFADLDGDGYLDLFVGRYVKFSPKTPEFCEFHGVKAGCGVKDYDPGLAVVYRNDGHGHFADVTRQWGFDQGHGKCLGVAVRASDTGPGMMLYSANDEEPGDLFVRRGARYENVGVSSGTAMNRDGLTQAGMGVDWGDYLNSGRPGLVVATFQTEAKCLYRNDGRELYMEQSGTMGIAAPTIPYIAFTAKFMDYDNDGWLDLFFASGHTQDNVSQIQPDKTYAQPMQLFHNEHGQPFIDVSAQAGPAFRQPIVGRGAALGDFNNDGNQDLLVVDDEGAALLLRNENKQRSHWLGIALTGVHSNRDGVGARIRVTVGGRTILRDQSLCGGYASCHDPRVHFGLGPAAKVDRVEVRWPDGRVDMLRNVAVDRCIRIAEGGGS